MRMFEVSATASNIPSTTFSPLVTTAYTRVLRRLERSDCSEKNCRKLSSPIHSDSKRSQRVKAK